MSDPTAVAQHRPWPLPSSPWIMRQEWNDLLFAHWRVPLAALRPLVPAALPIDEFDGSAWVSLTPFLLTGMRARGLPAFPVVSSFPELNVRTYVTLGGKPGVFFFSLDAGSRAAVLGARTAFRLPYEHAEMEIVRPAGREAGGDGEDEAEDEGWFEYRCRREGPPPARFDARYRPSGPVYEAGPGSLDHFLAERYCLYTAPSEGKIWRVEVHHAPWPLQNAEAEIRENTMAAAAGIELPAEAPLLRYARYLDVVNWAPEGAGG
jgi:uncharacterized protein